MVLECIEEAMHDVGGEAWGHGKECMAAVCSTYSDFFTDLQAWLASSSVGIVSL